MFHKRCDRLLALEQERIEKLLALLARKEAPAEEAWWQADASPQAPVVPPECLWDESGLYFTDPDDEPVA